MAIRDLSRGMMTRLPGPNPFTWTRTADAHAPVWSGNGSQLVFTSGIGPDDARTFRLKSPTEEPESLGLLGSPLDWSTDGRLLLTNTYGQTVDLAVVALDGPRKLVPFVSSPLFEWEGQFAPHSGGPPRWVAYTASGPQGSDVYVQGFSEGKPATGAKWKISVSGGEQPRWRRDGKELYYRDRGRIMAVPLDITGPEFRASTPVPLFEARPGADYVVAGDGSRFLLSEAIANQQPPPRPPVTIMLNWQARLR